MAAVTTTSEAARTAPARPGTGRVIVEDISIGAGLLGKVYKGGRIYLEQAPVADGLWFLESCGIAIEGRKVFFSFDKSRQVVVTEYRHVGPPENVLAMLHQELQSLSTANEPAGAHPEQQARAGGADSGVKAAAAAPTAAFTRPGRGPARAALQAW